MNKTADKQWTVQRERSFDTLFEYSNEEDPHYNICSVPKSLLDQLRRDAVDEYLKHAPALLKSALNTPLDEDVLALALKFESKDSLKFYSLNQLSVALQEFKNNKVQEAKKKLLDEIENQINSGHMSYIFSNAPIKGQKWKEFRAKTLGEK